jgi:phenylalanyl-tRNA synthetase, alpha subunit (EC 6.1.1.20)
MGWPGYSFRDLLGFLTQFARKLGLNIKFKPAYFPFTEPSVEGYAKIGNSLVEVFGAGLFRPEVLRIAGVDYPVGAWGMGVERLALAKYGLKDVRDLYSKDAEFLASFRFEV